ncbi:MAG: hypothetical protein LBB37_04070 [Endomicrobium sp.]|jgi:hypothetical protein|nr:hypothetical protein [Endomicrobium sp.]
MKTLDCFLVLKACLVGKLQLNIQSVDMQLPISYKCTATFGLGWDLEASVTIPLSSYFSVGIGCEYYHFSSLQGQRHITGNILNIDETSININKTVRVLIFLDLFLIGISKYGLRRRR